MMIEVFKTNVEDRDHADLLLNEIARVFKGYRGNFDLDDCDRILRITCAEPINATALIQYMATRGYCAEVLPDQALDLDFILNELYGNG